MLRRLKPVLASLLTVGAFCLLAACGPDIKTKEKVREDLLTHLSKAGLDTRALDIDVTQVTFEKNLAHAAVSFRPKASQNIHDGMMMNYTLESRDGHWVVTGRADSQGHGGAQAGDGSGSMGGGGNLPPGHPSLNEFSNPNGGGAPQGAQPLPPGHPKVEGGGSGSPEAKPLPPGHPKVSRNFGAQPVTAALGTGLAA